METKGVSSSSNNNKKMKTSSYIDPNGLPPSLPTRFEGDGAEGERYYFEGMFGMMKPFLRKLLQVELNDFLQLHFPTDLQSLRKRKERGDEVIMEYGMEYKLVFFNEPASITFTNNQIKAENDEPVIVAILDATTNAIVCTGLLSSAKLEFFLVDGDYDGSGQQHQPLSPRHGKRPLMVGKDLNNLTLQNGVASLHSLSITDNSSWIKSNKFRLGVKIVRDDKILAMFPIIPLAVSQPFRVMDHQGEVHKKYHPPSKEDEVWRLEGIGKDGIYHKNLSSHGINNVGDFLKAYLESNDPTSLKKLLGNKVPKKLWEVMVENAKECVNFSTNKQTSEVNNWPYEVMVDGHEAFGQENNLGYGSSQMPESSHVMKTLEMEI